MFAIPRLAPIVTFFQLAFAVFAAFMFAFSPEFLEQFGIAEDSADPPTRFLAGGFAVMYAHHVRFVHCSAVCRFSARSRCAYVRAVSAARVHVDYAQLGGASCDQLDARRNTLVLSRKTSCDSTAHRAFDRRP
eukprot:TRINITY_DN790_c0_g1_i2.p2 TRINITY_DN790_c0_g1~~TRINITY_DN790_c0_g1_i2.p2  ORF type:complete len:148 (-),score=30.28 TRINITY_DN790_c0_g1_i2:235-633(-)